MLSLDVVNTLITLCVGTGPNQTKLFHNFYDQTPLQPNYAGSDPPKVVVPHDGAVQLCSYCQRFATGLVRVL